MRELDVSDSIVITGVDPIAAYDAVSDVAQMGRWSPENRGAAVATKSLKVGDTFDGRNKRGPALAWIGRAKVLAAEPGKVFRFRTESLGISSPWLRHPGPRPGIATWEYRFEAVDGGTRVTESWHDDRPWPDFLAALTDPILTGSKTFADFQRRNIATTLARLKSELEPRVPGALEVPGVGLPVGITLFEEGIAAFDGLVGHVRHSGGLAREELLADEPVIEQVERVLEHALRLR